MGASPKLIHTAWYIITSYVLTCRTEMKWGELKVYLRKVAQGIKRVWGKGASSKSEVVILGPLSSIADGIEAKSVGTSQRFRFKNLRSLFFRFQTIALIYSYFTVSLQSSNWRGGCLICCSCSRLSWPKESFVSSLNQLLKMGWNEMRLVSRRMYKMNLSFQELRSMVEKRRIR